MNRLVRLVRSQALRVLTMPPLAALWTRANGPTATVLMFHRFADPIRGNRGFSPVQFRMILAYARRHGYALLDLEEMIRSLLAGRPIPQRSIAITIDDGYADQFEIAVPILAEFDAPAAIFLPSGFLDRTHWMWWDQVEYLFAKADRPRLEFDLDGKKLAYDLATVSLRTAGAEDFAEHCKALTHAESRTAIERLASQLGLTVPDAAPPEYQPMTWDQVRIAERFGIRFGPSTVTHPVIARVEDTVAEWEIRHSWLRVKAETLRPLPVFCYPNGLRNDFGERDRRLIQSEGLLGAVTAEGGYVARAGLEGSPTAAFAIPRFSGTESLPRLVLAISGFERIFNREPAGQPG